MRRRRRAQREAANRRRSSIESNKEQILGNLGAAKAKPKTTKITPKASQAPGDPQQRRACTKLHVRGGGNVGKEQAGWKTNGSTTGKKKIYKRSFQMA